MLQAREALAVFSMRFPQRHEHIHSSESLQGPCHGLLPALGFCRVPFERSRAFVFHSDVCDIEMEHKSTVTM